MAITGAVGVLLGILMGYGPRWLDAVLVLILDSMNAEPMILFALALIAVIGPGRDTLILVIVLGSLPGYARLILARVLALRSADYIVSEQSFGASGLRTGLVHLMPNVVGPLVILRSMAIPVGIMVEAGLSFIGFGVRPPEPSWGVILNDGLFSLRFAPTMVMFAGLPLVLATLGFTFLGEGLRDALVPRFADPGAAMSAPEQRALRGRDIAMVFQDPMTAFNPVLTIGDQLCDFQHASGLSRKDRRKRAEAMLTRVGIFDASARMNAYAHEFSGGMRQRAAIAAALLMTPDLLIADEPTTALDVTMEAQILHLLRELRAEYNGAIVLVTHHLGVIAELCDRVYVMYAGKVCFDGSATPDAAALRRASAMMFQDAVASLSPRQRIGALLVEPFLIHNIPLPDRAAKARGLLASVGLPPHLALRFPHALSGGQARRLVSPAHWR